MLSNHLLPLHISFPHLMPAMGLRIARDTSSLAAQPEQPNFLLHTPSHYSLHGLGYS